MVNKIKMPEWAVNDKWCIRQNLSCGVCDWWNKNKMLTGLKLGGGVIAHVDGSYNFLCSNGRFGAEIYGVEITLEEFNEYIYDTFTLPEQWYLNKTEKKDEQNQIWDWMQTQSNGTHWLKDYAAEYHLHSSNSTYRSAGGWSVLEVLNDYTLISFKQFVKYVVKTPELEPEIEDLSFLSTLFNELNIK